MNQGLQGNGSAKREPIITRMDVNAWEGGFEVSGDNHFRVL